MIAGALMGVLALILPGVPAAIEDDWIERSEHLTRGKDAIHLSQHARRYVYLATPTVWNSVSNLTAYRNKLYAVGSTLYRNHNSADIYRYDPRRGALRYEMHLFSQDAGKPAVFNGLLYVPAEDSRFSSGRVEVYISNGDDWRWQQRREASAIHVHAMMGHGGRLYAAAAAWNGLLYVVEPRASETQASGTQASRNSGIDNRSQWRLLYSHPTPDKRVTRLNSLLLFQDSLYVGGYSQSLQEHYLFKLSGDDLLSVPALPESRWTIPLAEFDGAMLVKIVGGKHPGLYRFDGSKAEPLPGLNGYAVNDAMTDGNTLIVAATLQGRGVLLESSDGRNFRTVQEFGERQPLSLAKAAGQRFIGMRVPKGRGELWASDNEHPTGVLWSRLFTLAEFADIEARVPAGTSVRVQISRESQSAFTGADGTGATSFPWNGGPFIKSPAGYWLKPVRGRFRIKAMLQGAEGKSPYIVWRQPPAVQPLPPVATAALAEPAQISAALAQLDKLTDLKSFWDIRPFGKGVGDVAATGGPVVSRWIERQIAREREPLDVRIFGGKYKVSIPWMYRHYLLMGLLLTGEGFVPPALWEAPYRIETNPMEKYFSQHEAAIFVAGMFRQGDSRTVASLVELLAKDNLPLWFKGDVVGALTRITDQRFGYDFSRWAAWHRGDSK